MYYRARYYHSELGRFVSRDPVGYDAGDMNLYRYVYGNPVIFVDPSGLWYDNHECHRGCDKLYRWNLYKRFWCHWACNAAPSAPPSLPLPPVEPTPGPGLAC